MRWLVLLAACAGVHGADFASFASSGNTTIQALTADAHGNLYVAGATNSANFPVKNAAQPALAEAAVMRSTDLGTSWTRVGLPASTLIAITPDPVSAATLYVSSSAGIYKSLDGGQNWALIYPTASGNPVAGGLAIDPANPLHLAAILTFNGSLLRSFDGGATWSTAALLCPQSSCGGTPAADPSGSGALLVGISLSRDWGTTFKALYAGGFGGYLAVFDPSHPGWIYFDAGAGTFGQLSLTQDFGATWTAKASPPTPFSALNGLAVDPSQPNVLVAESPDGFYVSNDGAQSWTLPARTAAFSPDSFHPFALMNHQCGGGGMFAIGSGAGPRFSADFSPDDGVTWKAPQMTGVTKVALGAGCAAYVTKTTSTNAFAAKIASGGTVEWATYLGGSDQDSAAGIGVDAQGNVYVSGATYSPDFPATLPRIGVAKPVGVFVTKFSPTGQIAYSVVMGGDQTNGELAFAVDAQGDAYVAGNTDSTQFPTTPGALFSTVSVGSYTGFVAKLSPAGALVYSTLLGPSGVFAYGLAVDANGNAILAGTNNTGNPAPFVEKLNPTGTAILAGVSLQAGSSFGGTPSPLAFDGQGNILVAGQAAQSTVTPTGYVSPAPVSQCTAVYDYTFGAGGFVMKLDPSNLSTIASALFQSPCGMTMGALVVDASGAVTVSMATGAGLALKSPVLAGPACGLYSSAVATLSGDLKTLEFATYLDGCTAPALASNGTLYASAAADVVSLAAPAPGLSLNGIANLFSGDASAVVSGGLYTLSLSNFAPPAASLGLHANLPETLNGVEVFLDDMPARIVSVGPGAIVAAATERPVRPVRGQKPAALTSVRVVYNGSYSAVLMPVAACVPGLLTSVPQPGSTFPDGYVLNQDGTVNSASNPAAAGSTITVTVTGIGATNSSTPPGRVAASSAVTPDTSVYASWRNFNLGGSNPAETVEWIPGELDSVFQIPLVVPASVETSSWALGGGLYRVPLGLRLRLPLSDMPPIVSNQVGIYVK